MRPDVAQLRALTIAAAGANYEVWDGEWCADSGLTLDMAIGFAKGLIAAGPTYIGREYNPVVKVGTMIVWPEERWGEGASWATLDGEAES